VTRTLLLADDSLTIQRVIELTFADENVHVVAASDGDQAIAILDRSLPDIVLADIGMPGRNGYEVARYVKETPRLAHLPVILLAGEFEPVDEAATAICDGVLTKPFEPQLLIDRVRALLGIARSEVPVPPDADLILRPAPAQAEAGLVEAPAASSGKAEPEGLDDYFERLDRAFASRATPAARGEPDGASLRAPVASQREDDSVMHAPEPAGDAALESPTVAPQAPPLAELFAALLAAERSLPAPTAPPPGAVSGDLVDEVVRRVLERMSDRVIRDTVVDLVAETTERLIRAEIERIKSSIK
jgi:CheY-like chemotaxis protein